MDWSERIGRRIRLRDLHILLAVVECKSLAMAAERLAISRPVISKVIAELEQVLGVRVLERDRHGAEPTPYGAALLKRSLVVFDELRESVKDIESIADPTAGEVRIGCNPILATSFVSHIVYRLARRFPRVVFNVVARQAEVLHRELTDRNVDLLVARRLPGLVDDRFRVEVLFDDRDVVAASVRSPWARRRNVELGELINEAWVLPPSDNVVGSVVARAFDACGLTYPLAAVVSDSPHVRMSLVATGRFLSIFPGSALEFSDRGLGVKVLPVRLTLPNVPVAIVTLKNRMLSPVTQLFIKHARELGSSQGRCKS
jgi:DNA-binding transcriptional LysR family regulator